MPQTLLHVASASVLSGKEWSDEAEIAGEANDVVASYKANGADAASLSLTFDTADIPENAEIGEVTARVWGSWSGPGEPQDVVLTLAGGPGPAYVFGEPGVRENTDPAGWGLGAAAFNTLEATLALTTLDAETYNFDAVEIEINWTTPPPRMSVAKRAMLVGIFGFGM